jgi:hypothetical protein
VKENLKFYLQLSVANMDLRRRSPGRSGTWCVGNDALGYSREELERTFAPVQSYMPSPHHHRTRAAKHVFDLHWNATHVEQLTSTRSRRKETVTGGAGGTLTSLASTGSRAEQVHADADGRTARASGGAQIIRAEHGPWPAHARAGNKDQATRRVVCTEEVRAHAGEVPRDEEHRGRSKGRPGRRCGVARGVERTGGACQGWRRGRGSSGCGGAAA